MNGEHRQPPLPDDDPRVRALEDGAGYSHNMAESMVTGESMSRVQPYPTSRRMPQTRHNRRHLSPYADGDSELDPNWNPPYIEKSEEDKERYAEAAQRGHALGTETLLQHRRQRIINDPNLHSEQKAERLAAIDRAEQLRLQRRGRA